MCLVYATVLGWHPLTQKEQKFPPKFQFPTPHPMKLSTALQPSGAALQMARVVGEEKCCWTAFFTYNPSEATFRFPWAHILFILIVLHLWWQCF